MTGIKDEERCRECNGIGLLRNDDPNSDRMYGDYCPSCNVTGMAATKKHWLAVVLIVNVAATAATIWYFWP